MSKYVIRSTAGDAPLRILLLFSFIWSTTKETSVIGEGLDFKDFYKGREKGKCPVVIVACVDTQQ